jgi:hypothetical protein
MNNFRSCDAVVVSVGVRLCVLQMGKKVNVRLNIGRRNSCLLFKHKKTTRRQDNTHEGQVCKKEKEKENEKKGRAITRTRISRKEPQKAHEKLCGHNHCRKSRGDLLAAHTRTGL